MVYKIPPISAYHRLNGSRKAGNVAFKNKTGIHSLSKDEIKRNAIKGGRRMKLLMSHPEYRDLHVKKVKFGMLKARFNRKQFFNF